MKSFSAKIYIIGIKAKTVFEKLAPYRQKEIVRYIANMKTEESVMRNIEKIIQHLTTGARFAGRD